MHKKIHFLCTVLLFISLLSFQQKSYGQIPAPTLHCVDIATSNSIYLEWESNANCGLGNNEFVIWVSTDPNGSFVEVARVDGMTLNYTDNNLLNSPTDSQPLYYSVTEVCAGQSSNLSASVVGTNQPITPDILSVTVRSDSTVEVTWDSEETGTLTALGYIISRSNENGSIVDIDTFFTSESDPTSEAGDRYVDTLPPSINHPVEYIIAAFNRCSERTPGILAHSTMGLTVVGEGCDAQALLSWTPYVGWGTQNTIYDVIFTDENNVDTIIAMISGTAPTNHVYDIPSNFSGGGFKIKARRLDSMSEDETSCSNIAPLDVEAATGPAYICVTNASVDEDGFIDLVWQIDASQDRNSLMYRSWTNTQAENPQNFTPISDALPTTAQMNIRDERVNTNDAFYTYRLVHKDQCNRETISGTVTTMLLSTSGLATGSMNRLSWNPFEITNGTVSSYRIYRTISTENNFEPIDEINATTGSGAITYVDNNLETDVQRYCYRVEAIYNINCPEANYNETLSSFSNTICTSQFSRLIVPNAFTPNEATNNIFKPTIIFPNSDSYQMVIVNRWGENVYSTTNPDDGWDGKLRGEIAPQGVYLYHITMSTPDGDIKRKGSLLLIR